MRVFAVRLTLEMEKLFSVARVRCCSMFGGSSAFLCRFDSLLLDFSFLLFLSDISEVAFQLDTKVIL